jgi:hypothetical protein
VVLVADPQLIDPHSYPGRPWPLNPLTYLVTDNYLRRSYTQLQEQLLPDTVFFLGDLFDGGREWKTAHGDFRDPEWSSRPARERKYQKMWNRKYGEDFWLREYARFGKIFLDPWIATGDESSPGQRGKKMIATLPGNHDLGFGSEVKIPVRNRFEAYFGDGNRVDVIGNHTFVSVDTPSLSAASSEQAADHDLRAIYFPADAFISNVQWTMRKAVEKELRHQRGTVEEVMFKHKIEDVDKADFKTDQPHLDPGNGKAVLPNILLTHVPLYRQPGTPCGPMREHWPPAKPPKGQTTAVFPDHRNAISVSRGYQYQNVLSQEDSVKLINSIGNVVQVFSGDDHDYCEVVHDAEKKRVREITVKSISMAMGVPTPGFLMVSLYNPIDADGKSLSTDGKPTLQTHLCLLPKQLSTYLKYAAFAVLCLVVLVVRAVLVPALNLTPFALDSLPTTGAVLPVFKAKIEDYDEYGTPPSSATAAGFSGSRRQNARDRSSSLTPGAQKPNGFPGTEPKRPHRQSLKGQDRWSWGGGPRGPKIEIRSDDAYYDGGKWKAAAVSRPRSGSLKLVIRELWATAWRVAWMVVVFWFYLAWKG